MFSNIVAMVKCVSKMLVFFANISLVSGLLLTRVESSKKAEGSWALMDINDKELMKEFDPIWEENFREYSEEALKSATKNQIRIEDLNPDWPLKFDEKFRHAMTRFYPGFSLGIPAEAKFAINVFKDNNGKIVDKALLISNVPYLLYSGIKTNVLLKALIGEGSQKGSYEIIPGSHWSLAYEIKEINDRVSLVLQEGNGECSSSMTITEKGTENTTFLDGRKLNEESFTNLCKPNCSSKTWHKDSTNYMAYTSYAQDDKDDTSNVLYITSKKKALCKVFNPHWE